MESGVHDLVPLRELHSDGDGEADVKIPDKESLLDKVWVYFHCVLLCAAGGTAHESFTISWLNQKLLCTRL